MARICVQHWDAGHFSAPHLWSLRTCGKMRQSRGRPAFFEIWPASVSGIGMRAIFLRRSVHSAQLSLHNRVMSAMLDTKVNFQTVSCSTRMRKPGIRLSEAQKPWTNPWSSMVRAIAMVPRLIGNCFVAGGRRAEGHRRVLSSSPQHYSVRNRDPQTRPPTTAPRAGQGCRLNMQTVAPSGLGIRFAVRQNISGWSVSAPESA